MLSTIAEMHIYLFAFAALSNEVFSAAALLHNFMQFPVILSFGI